MKATKSPLVLDTFFLLENRYKFIQPEEPLENVQEQLFGNYHIDIDFTTRAISSREDTSQVFDVFTKIGINNIKQPLAGYSLFLEGVGRYILDKEIVSEKEVENLKNLSALTMSIGLLRGVLMDITSNAPMGKYILPSIAVFDLIKEKASQKKRRTKTIAKE